MLVLQWKQSLHNITRMAVGSNKKHPKRRMRQKATSYYRRDIFLDLHTRIDEVTAPILKSRHFNPQLAQTDPAIKSSHG